MKFKTTLKTSLILNFAFFFCSLSEVEAQNIGINGSGANAHPSALLDVNASSTPSLGILIPRIALQAINLAAPVTSPATSLLVYNTASASTGTNAVSAGYYYWDGTKWVRFQMANAGSSSTSWDVLGNTGTVAGTNFLGTTDNQDVVFKTNNVERMRLSNLGVLTNDNVANVLGVDIQGINMGSQRWSINNTGFAAAFHNQSNAAFANALLLKTVGTATSNVILELSTGTATGVATSVMIARGDGNVGIGTGYPKSILHIQSARANDGIYLFAPVGNGGEISFQDNTHFNWSNGRTVNPVISMPNYGIAVPSNTTGYGPSAETWLSGNGGVAFFTHQFQRMLIDVDGKVGIGTNTPTKEFQTWGTIESSFSLPGTTHSLTTYANLIADGSLRLYRTKAASTFTSSNGYIDFVSDAGVGYDFRMSFERDHGITGSLVFSDNVNSFMQITQGAGRVGIHVDRTPGPQTNLQVGANFNDGISVIGGLGGGDVGDFIFFEKTTGIPIEKGRISTVTTSSVSGLIFSGSNTSGGINHMNITQAGNVGIGVPTPLFKLDVSATMRVVATTYTSDRRKKQNIKPLVLNSLDIIKKLNPVTYDWIEVLDDGMKGTQLGFIAQELEDVIPSIVVTANDEQKSKSVKYNELLAIYAKAIQEQQTQIEDLKLKADKVNELQSQIELLKQQNETILKLIEKK